VGRQALHNFDGDTNRLWSLAIEGMLSAIRRRLLPKREAFSSEVVISQIRAN